MANQEFLLPDVGEGLTEAEIVSWKVAPGDSVAVNQVLVEIETAKSLVELPSPFAGVVLGLLVDEGATVDVGTPIISVTSSDGSASDAAGFDSVATESSTTGAADAVAAVPPTPLATPSSAAPAAEEGGAVLVGYGLKGHVASRRRTGTAPAAAARSVLTASPSAAAATAAPTAPSAAQTATTTASPAAATAKATHPPTAVLAKPPIRKLARDLGVALAEVVASGVIGEVTRDDVLRHASAERADAATGTATATDTGAPTERETRIPVKGVRKAIANAMVTSAFTAPHVSLFVDVDATRTMEFVKRLKVSSDFEGIKVSPLLIMVKAMIWAARRNPTVNAQWTDSEIIVKSYINFGIAAATPRGLIVPNIREAQELSLVELARAIEQLTVTARAGTTPPAAMQAGTITVTNIGVFGMDTGTPILNPGEVAIVAFGTVKLKPWVVDGEVRPRFVTTIGGSFDHRVVDGDVASRFLADVASIIEEPALLLE